MNELFIYNAESGELFCSQKYDGGEIPENATLKIPPSTKENETPVFKNGEWIILKDYRFTHRMIDSDNNLEYITELGDIPEGWELITNEQAEEFEKRKKLNSLSMTKLDFYKFALQPNGVSYETLLSILNENIEMKAVWDLCSRVFRGDNTLCENITNLVPGLTDDILDNIFEEHGSLII